VELVYPPVIGVARLLFRALDLRITVTGAENVPRSGGAVLASNHVSYLDFVFCGLAGRHRRRLTRFMAKQEVFAHPVAGPLMRGMHHIPVDRSAGAGSFRHAAEALRAG
jgi:1-acyl-sn-glycerol-3-phosphate acyltransferase